MQGKTVQSITPDRLADPPRSLRVSQGAQQDLFRDNEPATSFWLDAQTGNLMRTVRRFDKMLPAISTVMGKWDGNRLSDDLAGAAEATWLRTKEPLPIASEGEDLRVVDLFSGCGAMSLGIAEACRALNRPFKAIGAFDVDDVALRVYEANFGKSCGHEADLGKLFSKRLSSPLNARERILKKTLQRVDFVVAGPPCQGHSNLNNVTRRDDPRNKLYFTVARFARIFKPRWVLIENVINVRHDKGGILDKTQSALEGIGYAVQEDIVDLWEIGVPQTRKRHVLVAVLSKGERRVERQAPTVEEIVLRHSTQSRSVGWAIGDLEGRAGATPLDAASIPKDFTQKRIDWLFDNERYDLPDRLRPYCHKDQEHSYQSVYGRMRRDRPAPTITGGFLTMGRGRFVHYAERRTMTAHEAARIQFIPDFFDFSPGLSKRTNLARLIGNAVPPKLSYVIALELLR